MNNNYNSSFTVTFTLCILWIMLVGSNTFHSASHLIKIYITLCVTLSVDDVFIEYKTTIGWGPRERHRNHPNTISKTHVYGFYRPEIRLPFTLSPSPQQPLHLHTHELTLAAQVRGGQLISRAHTQMHNDTCDIVPLLVTIAKMFLCMWVYLLEGMVYVSSSSMISA